MACEERAGTDASEITPTMDLDARIAAAFAKDARSDEVRRVLVDVQVATKEAETAA
jgi:hypothetical protein